MSRDCCVALPCGAMVLSAVCECGISWSYSLTIRQSFCEGHRPVIVKRIVTGSKGGWKLRTIFLSCKMFHDWSIIKIRKYIVFIRWLYLCCTFWNNISLLLLIKFTGVAYKKRTLHFAIFFNENFLSCRVPTFRGQKVVKHGGHHGISYLFIGWTRSVILW